MQQDYEKLKGVIWYNGRFVNAINAKLHVLSHGLHFASVTFEGIRVYNRVAFKLEDHIDRLFKSSSMLQIKIPFSKKKIIYACKRLIHNQKL